MKLAPFLVAVGLLLFPVAGQTADGVVVKKSNHPVGETIDRLAAILTAKGLTIVARIDHAAGASKAGLDLRPTAVLIFGNPKLGTPLMQAAPTVAIDLPQKALAYEDAAGDVYLLYNDPAYLAARHGIAGRDAVLKKIAGALDRFTDAAVE
jgi:uncharacterized protein (DUF302 family)